MHSADVPYNNLLGTMFDINAGYFLIQLASERDKDPVFESIGKHLRTDADGVTQMAYIGCTVTQSPRVESPQEIANTLIRAANFIPKEQLGLDRRLRLLPVLDRREAQPRVAGLRPRRGLRQDQVAGRGHAGWPRRSSASDRAAGAGHFLRFQLVKPAASASSTWLNHTSALVRP